MKPCVLVLDRLGRHMVSRRRGKTQAQTISQHPETLVSRRRNHLGAGIVPAPRKFKKQTKVIKRFVFSVRRLGRRYGKPAPKRQLTQSISKHPKILLFRRRNSWSSIEVTSRKLCKTSKVKTMCFGAKKLGKGHGKPAPRKDLSRPLYVGAGMFEV